MAKQPKDLRELKSVASKYGLVFAGRTRRGHFRWRHPSTGRILISVSKLGNWREIANAERQFKRDLRGNPNGHHHPD